jgi:hypothetical protein
MGINPPQYDLFAGTFGDGDALWLEAIEGLGIAYEKMKWRAARVPGKYFVFCQSTHTVQASIDTSSPEKNANKDKDRRASSL